MFALLSASYMLALLAADPCVSEVENVPSKNETIAYKCFPPDVKPPKKQTWIPSFLLLTEADAWQKNPYKKRDNHK
jgi:hypothetical protein